MSAAYSAMVRSLENLPDPATLRIAFRAQPSARLEVRPQVREVHVVVAVREQGVSQRLEGPGLVLAEMVGEEQVQRGAGLRVVVVVPARAVPAPAPGHLRGSQAEEEEVLLAGLLRHLDGRAIARADR